VKKSDVARRVTMRDVAALVGVSHQTVSRALNEPDRVNAETRIRIQEVMQSLRYQRNGAARALATRRTRSIGLISTGLTLHSHSKRMIAINEAARAEGYQVSMASLPRADRVALQAELDAMQGQGIEGVVLIAADKQARDVIDSLLIDVPVIISGITSHQPSISIDLFEGARLATAHLADLGHHDIGHLAGPDWSVDAEERMRGWRTELESRGLPVSGPRIGDWTVRSGYERGLEFASARDATAIFCANDRMAVGLIAALHERGVDVPGQVSLVGYDDIPEAEFLVPSLTTIRQDLQLLGRQIISALLALLGEESVVDVRAAQPELIVRNSTGPPPA
jgi:DNA-binding LacI/PurR family transcriptional regulator